MTHFSQADSEKVDYFHKQLARWHELTDTLPKPPMIHVANSGAAMYHADEIPHDVIRAGTVVYGIEPSLGELRKDDYLQQIERLETELVFVKQMHEATVSRTATSTTPTKANGLAPWPWAMVTG